MLKYKKSAALAVCLCLCASAAVCPVSQARAEGIVRLLSPNGKKNLKSLRRKLLNRKK